MRVQPGCNDNADAEGVSVATTEALALQRSVASSLDCLRDEDTQSVYDNVNENDNLF